MLHETLNPANWQKHLDTYDTVYVEGMRGRFLIRRERLKDLPKCLNAVSKAYQTAQRQRLEWDRANWRPLLERAKSIAVDGVAQFHAKPTHDFKSDDDKNWWLYEYSESEGIGWGWSFKWVSEPKEKLNHELGQKWYELNNFPDKFSRHSYILGEILKGLLNQYVNNLYSREWLENNYFSKKLIKINLRGDEFWYRVGHNRKGSPMWENFIWQSNTTEELNA
jgi:hypothetical protein